MLSACLVTFATIAVFSGDARADEASPPRDRYVNFESAGVRLRQPLGFERSTDFVGLMYPETMASVMVSALPAPFQEASARFDAEGLASEGVRMISRVPVKVDGHSGLLIEARQLAAGVPLSKWILMAGDETNTKLLMATFPSDSPAQLSRTLKDVLLEARFTEMSDPGASRDVGFTIVPAKGLKLNSNARGMGNVLLYSVNPVAKSPEEPLFTAARSMGPLIGFEREQFAVLRTRDLGKVRGTSIQSKRPVSIDGLPGFEVVAKGEDVETGIPLVIYEVVLFLEDDSYYMMLGIVGASTAGKDVPKFRKMARSFKRTR
ncbi:MAG: hypothetical protein AAGF92_16000 [Myxococcota bacterium]